MLQLFTILLAIFIGYSFKRSPVSERFLSYVLNLAVLAILVIMGYEFGSSINNLTQQLASLSKITITCTIMLFLLNYFSLHFFIKARKIGINMPSRLTTDLPGVSQFILASGKYLFFVVVGVVAGYLIKINLTHINSIVSIVLLFILLIIGHQLRLQGAVLKQLFMNKLGLQIALLIVVSSLLVGVIVSFLLSIDLRVGLILCSGFGWYSLSGILTGQLINHQMGTIAFFIDFIREVIAIVLIPVLGRNNPYPMIGYSAATALDFTLPVIKANMNEDVLPIAISSGMFLTILVPILIPLLAKISLIFNIF